MSALLVLSDHRIAQETRRAAGVAAAEAEWRRGLRRRVFWLVVKGGATYVGGGILAWGSFALTGDVASIALWGGLLLSNAGPLIFSYAFWMREQGNW
ncbi:MAG: hypothetical protein DMD54_14610 [Gemmatimonadetes bacterium]|nr:MAG: hypothetical protein DMD54_14610 [Gemmatimonadota bacterium]